MTEAALDAATADALRQEIQDLKEDNLSLRRTIENLQAREAPLDRFKAAIQEAHVGARHLGPWDICPHPVCRGLESYLQAEAKDRRG